MSSLVAFGVIVAVIVGIILLVIVGAGVFVFLTEGGGCFLIIGLAVTIGGIALVANVGGVAGGFGILFALIGCLLIWGGASMFKDWLK
jgi:hypothetical protein